MPKQAETNALENIINNTELINILHEIIIVNDSCTKLPKPHEDIAKTCNLIRIINLPKNLARASACNHGAKVAEGDILWILDADCIPIKNIHEAIKNIDWVRFSAITGKVENTYSDNFWKLYQKSRRALRQGQNTQNFLIKKELFHEIGGFDETFKTYGFEDRDLLARIPLGVISYEPTIIVEHEGYVDLKLVREKMFYAATSGGIFSKKHPNEYKESDYYKVDSRFNSVSRNFLLSCLSKFEAITSPLLNALINSKFLPFAIKKHIVIVTSATAYYRGSKEKTL